MKPKLNKEERIAAYREAMTQIAGDVREGLCLALTYANPRNLANSREYYPEVFTRWRVFKYTIKKRVTGDGYWFNPNLNGQAKPIVILHKAIGDAKQSKY